MSQNNSQRPTPETEAEVKRIQADQSIFVCEEFNVLRDFARNLERQRDEARESKDRIAKRAEAIRCELVEKDKQLEDMREAIKEAQAALFRYEVEDVDLQAGEEMSISVSADDQQSLRAAIAKLKPFLKP